MLDSKSKSYSQPTLFSKKLSIYDLETVKYTNVKYIA